MRSVTNSVIAVLLFAACGDDVGPGGAPGSSSETSADGSASGTTTSEGADSSTSVASSTTELGTSTSTDGADSSGGTSGGEDTTYIALIRGTMSTQDLDEAKALHDAIAGEAMGPAMAAGDFGHDPLLGTTLLGTTENEFLALDRWTNLDGANAVYSDPAFLRAFGSFFARPPALDLFERQTTWAEYGEFDIADDDPEHVFVIVRGRIGAGRDAHALHDRIVGGSSRAAMMAGDLAHLVYLGVDDPQEFFAIDIWGDSAGLEAFYGDPAFQAAVGMLFEAPPSVTVYRSTDWLGW